MKSTAILIPARYGSTRYPGKPLAKLDGVPMIKRVYDACTASKIPTFVLTDDKRIADLIPAQYCYIDKTDYENGTERCAGAVLSRKFEEFDQFINVQGDMPDVTTEMLSSAVVSLNSFDVSTVYTDMPSEMQADPNSVKMIKDSKDAALWFGRGITGYGEWHLGVYGYTKEAIKVYPQLRKYPEEDIEKLEQLRWLKNGWQIGCKNVYFNGVEINTLKDVETWNAKQTY